MRTRLSLSTGHLSAPGPSSLMPVAVATSSPAPSWPSSPISHTPYPLRPPNASEILPRLYVSDLAFAENPAALASLGITHVLSAMRGSVALPSANAYSPPHPSHPTHSHTHIHPSAAATAAAHHHNHNHHNHNHNHNHAPHAYYAPHPIHRAQYPLDDLPFSELAAHLPHTTAFLRAALSDPDARVLVHCMEGVSRSASVVAAYLIAEYGWSPAQAIQFVKTRRRAAEPNVGFVQQLHEYADSLRSGGSRSS